MTVQQPVNIIDFYGSLQHETLELIRTSHVEIAVIPFTADGKQIHFHYREEADIRGYVLCNGPGCLLCRIGHKADQRILLPVYLPTSGLVGVLPVSTSMTPLSLLPQILKSLKSNHRCVLFIRREGAKFFVQQADITPQTESGETIISDFMERYTDGKVDLSSVYNRVENEFLAQVPEIARMMALKGIQLDADQR